MKKIHIPNPCPEKWSDMSPTKDGAMCGVCATEVVDFTNKTPEEIQETLRLAMGKRICAKMAPPKEDLYKVPSYIFQKTGMEGFKSRFVYALVMVFGLTLFSCDSDEGWEGPVGMVSYEGDEYVVGDVEEVGMVEYEPDTTIEHKVGKVEIKDPDTLEEPERIGLVLPDED